MKKRIINSHKMQIIIRKTDFRYPFSSDIERAVRKPKSDPGSHLLRPICSDIP